MSAFLDIDPSVYCYENTIAGSWSAIHSRFLAAELGVGTRTILGKQFKQRRAIDRAADLGAKIRVEDGIAKAVKVTEAIENTY